MLLHGTIFPCWRLADSARHLSAMIWDTIRGRGGGSSILSSSCSSGDLVVPSIFILRSITLCKRLRGLWCHIQFKTCPTFLYKIVKSKQWLYIILWIFRTPCFCQPLTCQTLKLQNVCARGWGGQGGQLESWRLCHRGHHLVATTPIITIAIIKISLSGVILFSSHLSVLH